MSTTTPGRSLTMDDLENEARRRWTNTSPNHEGQVVYTIVEQNRNEEVFLVRRDYMSQDGDNEMVRFACFEVWVGSLTAHVTVSTTGILDAATRYEQLLDTLRQR